MAGLSFGIDAAGPVVWWPAGAGFAADFVNQRYMRDGNPIAAAEAFSLTRSSPKWAIDSRGTWLPFAANQPALTDLGLSIEPAATNLVPNPGLNGAVVGVVGAGGSLPTGWFHNGTLTTEVVAITTLSGLPALQLRISGVATSTFYELSMMPSTTSIAPSTNYTASVFAEVINGPAPLVQLRQGTNTDAQVGGSSLLPVGIDASERARSAFISQPSAQRCRIRLGLSSAIGVSYNLEVCVACPQLELGERDSSPLLEPRSAEGVSINSSPEAISLRMSHPEGVPDSLLPSGAVDPNLLNSAIVSAIEAR